MYLSAARLWVSVQKTQGNLVASIYASYWKGPEFKCQPGDQLS